MSSSDSEEDCYGSVVKKLNILKSQFTEDKVDTLSLLELPEPVEPLGPAEPHGPTEPPATPAPTEDPEDTSELDAVLAQSAIGFPKATARKAKKTAKTEFTFKSINDIPVTLPTPKTLMNVHSEASSSNKRPKRVTRSSSKRGGKTPGQPPVQSTLQPPNLATLLPELPIVQPPAQPPEQSTRAARGKKSTRANNIQSPLNNSRGANRTLQSRSRGTATRAGRARRRGWFFNDLPSQLHMALQQMIPTYSVGNTSEYPDALEHQQLFSSATQQQDTVVVEDETGESLDDYNEELSVKVYWQSWEYFKFTIRRYQKLKQIFDYFADKENVDPSLLLFTYNDKILKQDDTPDSINYSIAKFIDGGTVKESLSFDTKVNCAAGNTGGGIKIKFQFQNVKKPFETIVDPKEKLAVAMAKCSEHLEKPLKDLKFFFDGERINRDCTPQDLEFEGGECIDVKYSNT